MKKILQIWVCIMSVTFGLHYTQVVQAKARAVNSLKTFDSVLSNNNLVVALLYAQDKSTDKATKKEYKALKEQFSALSKEYSFQRADVYFALINVTQKQGGAIAQEYGIQTMPSVALFKDGETVKGSFGKPLLHTEPLTKTAMRDFINEHFAKRIEKRKKEKIEREEDRARTSYYYGPSWYYGYGLPYNYYGPWGYGYGYPYGGFSFSIGAHRTFGGGRHWHGGHRGGHGGHRGGGRGRHR